MKKYFLTAILLILALGSLAVINTSHTPKPVDTSNLGNSPQEAIQNAADTFDTAGLQFELNGIVHEDRKDPLNRLFFAMADRDHSSYLNILLTKQTTDLEWEAFIGGGAPIISGKEMTTQFTSFGDVQIWWGTIFNKDIRTIKANNQTTEIFEAVPGVRGWYLLLPYHALDSVRAYDNNETLLWEEEI
ncbi:hypothetical protein PAECIP111893_04790 [Paenibacillus plantiphilus]|uniref:Uncharacterized protein n=1 Tax=Paenibacillus plantiphilus TaxID=2905650 RepID=A0ABN8GZG3_9BACL|nr:hypothetical protein [Paenibacillus plantiphilus]CAH1221850.1 hypothetical protein PAECIP111893_04790 [Paenibacillus plantiphilus]